MARTFLTAINLAKNELQNAAVQNLATAPAAPVKGQLYYNSTGGDDTLYWWNGTQWVAAMGGAGAVPSDAMPTSSTAGGVSAAGAATTYARGDHAHGLNAGSVTAATTFGIAAANGVATMVARSDHTHGTPAHDATAHSALLGGVTGEQTFGSAPNSGSTTLISRSDHQHGNPVHDAAAHSTIPISALAAATAIVNMGGFRISNVAPPVNGTDAANKDYVDNLVAGLSWKDAVNVATTANITLSGVQSIDGVIGFAGQEVLVKSQTASQNNGIYLMAAGAWTRRTDMDTSVEFPNATVFVMEGTVGGDTAWTCVADDDSVLGTTPANWVQFGAGATYTAGAGLTLAGNVLNVGQGAGILVGADSIAIDSSVVVQSSRSVIAGAGLTGGGTLAADRTFDVGAGTGILVAADTVAIDTTVVALKSEIVRKYAAALTGTASPETVTHNLNTRDVTVQVVNGATPWQTVEVDVEMTTVNTLTLRYNPNIGTGFRVVVIG